MSTDTTPDPRTDMVEWFRQRDAAKAAEERARIVAWLRKEASDYAANGVTQFAGALRVAAAALERGEHE